jgi:phospholipid/cholesterol/gamma-HCH transport system substrate-binding protein
MRNTRALETGVGVFVALGLAAFIMLALQVSDLSHFGDEGGYAITARFDNIGGLKVRSPVTMAGVRLGRVSNIEFDEETFEAVVEILIQPKFTALPDDSSASVLTSGLLGEQYIGLEPGGSLENLQPGGEIEYTQSALVLEQVIGKFLFGKAEEGVQVE